MIGPQYQAQRVDDRGSFAERVIPFLARAEAVNNLPLRLLQSTVADEPMKTVESSSNEWWMAVVQSMDGTLSGMAMRTPPYSLILSQPCEGLGALVALLATESLPGVVGPVDLVSAFAERWIDKRGGRIEVGLKLGIYEADQVKTTPAVAGALRLATAADLTLIGEWLNAFHLEALPHDPAPVLPVTPDGYFIWGAENGEPVTMVFGQRCTAESAFIKSVFTPPMHRRCGYATAAVGAVTTELLAQGFERCFLFTNQANLISNSIYPKIGYRRISDYVHLRFGAEAGA
jgi:uncharacterized protein